mgnify:CR=1 FL=1
METAARHIPNDELHAYLDQALSRSQCVEIECHLATCRSCQAERNTVAALRDRTTALLATVAPVRVRIPPYEQLVAAHAAQQSTRRSVRRFRVATGLIAAGLVAAMVSTRFTGPAAATNESGQQERPTTVVAGPVLDRDLVALGPVVTAGGVPAPATVAASSRTSRRIRAFAEPLAEPVLQVSAIAPEGEQFALDGMWQAVDWRQAEDETAGNLPKIDGMPIIDIQLQRGAGDQRPVVVVAQRHPSGRIVRTIEGPMDRVEQLLERQTAGRGAPLRASFPAMTPPDYLIDGSSNARRGLRMLTVTGDFPADSLNALARSIEIRE